MHSSTCMLAFWQHTSLPLFFFPYTDKKTYSTLLPETRRTTVPIRPGGRTGPVHYCPSDPPVRGRGAAEDRPRPLVTPVRTPVSRTRTLQVQPEAWTGPPCAPSCQSPGQWEGVTQRVEDSRSRRGRWPFRLMTQRARGGPRPRLSVPMIAEANEAPARISDKKCWTTQSTSTFHGPRSTAFLKLDRSACMHMRTEVTGFGARVLAHKITTKNFLLGLF